MSEEITNQTIAYRILGWTREEVTNRTLPVASERCHFDPLSEIADDFTVFEVVKKWIDTDNDRYSLFYLFLSRLLRSRDSYYSDTVNQHELYYMDHYQAGDFSLAAMQATAIPADELTAVLVREIAVDRD